MTDVKQAPLAMVIVGGMFLVGRIVGGNKLTKPRVYDIIPDMDPVTGKNRKDQYENPMTLMRLTPLPGTPPFYRMGMDGNYLIPETPANKPMFDFYERATNPSVDPG